MTLVELLASRTLNVIEARFRDVIASTTIPSAHENLPADQLLATFSARLQIETSRAPHEHTWSGLEELVVGLARLGEQRVLTSSIETSAELFVAFFTHDELVAVLCKRLEHGR